MPEGFWWGFVVGLFNAALTLLLYRALRPRVPKSLWFDGEEPEGEIREVRPSKD